MQLNKWLGSDKPKKDDFIDDNQKVDNFCKAISQSVEKLESAQTNNAALQTVTQLSNSVTSHISNTTEHITAGERTLWSSAANNLTSHTGNSTLHITAAERAAWSSGAGLVCGSYSGNGTGSLQITLGYQPRYGLIFVVGDGAGRIAWSSEQYYTQCGMMSTLGCSKGITLNSDGFTVEHLPTGGIDGFGYRFNTSGVTYVYFLWK